MLLKLGQSVIYKLSREEKSMGKPKEWAERYIDWYLSKAVTVGIHILFLGPALYVIWPKDWVGLSVFYFIGLFSSVTFPPLIIAGFVKSTNPTPEEIEFSKNRPGLFSKESGKELLGGIGFVLMYAVFAAFVALVLDVFFSIKFPEPRFFALMLMLIFMNGTCQYWKNRLWPKVEKIEENQIMKS